MALRILAIFFFMIAALALKAQQRDIPEFDGYHKNVFVERDGATMGLGVNFDMRLMKGQMGGIGFRTGFGTKIFLENNSYIRRTFIDFNFPLEVNHLLGRRKSSLVTGIGIIPSFFSYSSTSGNTTYRESGFRSAGTFVNIGYRLQPRERGFMLQITWTPILDYNKRLFLFNLGLGLGYGFK